MQTHTVEGGGGLKLHVREWGKPIARPILFIHGWSQNHLCWSKQFEGSLGDEFRLVALDLRGHGQSEAPLDAESYTTGALWADDLKNVIEALRLDTPVLVGWSYAGLIICDYIRRYGDDAIAGVNFVAAAIGIGAPWFGTRIGPGFLNYAPPACSPDQTVALKAIRDFLHVCFVKPSRCGHGTRNGLEHACPPAGSSKPGSPGGGFHHRSGKNHQTGVGHLWRRRQRRFAVDGKDHPRPFAELPNVRVRGCRSCTVHRGPGSL
jgi:pimeloyl-ACP methyl ester carboxylesterase